MRLKKNFFFSYNLDLSFAPLQIKSRSLESHQEQLRQLECDMKEEWECQLNQFEQKYKTELAVLAEERGALERRVSELDAANGALRARVAKLEQELLESKRRVDDLLLVKARFERLQSETLMKRERFQSRIKELLDADPDPELIGEEVFNSLY